MSVRWLTRVWENETVPERSLLLLLALADSANDEGRCWPSRESLARKTRTSVSTVKRHMGELEEAGWLVVERRIGTSNVYRLAVPEYVQEEFPTRVTHDPGHSDPPPSTRSTRDPGDGSPVTRGSGHSRDPLTVREPLVNRHPAADAVGEAPTVPDASTLVSAWCDGYNETHAKPAARSVVGRVSGHCKRIAKTTPEHDVDAWRDAWRAARDAGKRGRTDVVGQLSDNGASAYKPQRSASAYLDVLQDMQDTYPAIGA